MAKSSWFDDSVEYEDVIELLKANLPEDREAEVALAAADIIASARDYDDAVRQVKIFLEEGADTSHWRHRARHDPSWTLAGELASPVYDDYGCREDGW